MYSSASGTTDKGSWEITDNQLILNSDKSDNDEIYTLHSNSGTAMAFYQRQTWLLLPDVVIDTLTLDYFEANTEMVFSKYAKPVELKMYFFFDREQ